MERTAYPCIEPLRRLKGRKDTLAWLLPLGSKQGTLIPS